MPSLFDLGVEEETAEIHSGGSERGMPNVEVVPTRNPRALPNSYRSEINTTFRLPFCCLMATVGSLQVQNKLHPLKNLVIRHAQHP